MTGLFDAEEFGVSVRDRRRAAGAVEAEAVFALWADRVAEANEEVRRQAEG